MSYKVSIITVVYNGAQTIEQTILSVLGQTYKNIEYIIIDGQSTDGTQNIVRKYMDSIDCFISEKDNGIYDAMNKGIRIATGEIIGIINSDDWYSENAVEQAIDYFTQKEVDLVYGKVCFVEQNGEKKIAQQLPLEMLWYRTVVYHPSVFIKKKIYEQFGFYNLKYKISSDYELLLRLYSHQVKFGYIDVVVAYFCLGGLSTTLQKESIEEHREISLKYINESLNKYELLEKHREWYIWACFSLSLKDKGVLLNWLYEYFHEKPLEIIIFGTGSWGKKCYKVLKDENIVVSLFLDNDFTKWDQSLYGVRVTSPQEVHNRAGFILIAVKNDGEKIKNQLKSFENDKLKYASLMDLKDLFRKKVSENIE